MNLQLLFRNGKILVHFPAFIHSIYLIILYSNNFWINFVSYSYLILSIIIFVLLVISIGFQLVEINFFDEEVSNEQSPLENKSLFPSFIALLLIFALIHLTSNKEDKYCSFLVSNYIAINEGTFYIRLFYRFYSDSVSVEHFIYCRTVTVHDTQICINVFWIILQVIFYYKFEKLVKLIPDQYEILPFPELEQFSPGPKHNSSNKSPTQASKQSSFLKSPKSQKEEDQPLLLHHEEEQYAESRISHSDAKPKSEKLFSDHISQSSYFEEEVIEEEEI